jgi:hypothetical protein
MAAPGSWKVSGAYAQVIVDTAVAHRYRITAASNSSVGTKIAVDNNQQGALLKPGECRDVMGKMIQVQITSNQGNAQASGTYDNLD